MGTSTALWPRLMRTSTAVSQVCGDIYSTESQACGDIYSTESQACGDIDSTESQACGEVYSTVSQACGDLYSTESQAPGDLCSTVSLRRTWKRNKIRALFLYLFWGLRATIVMWSLSGVKRLITIESIIIISYIFIYTCGSLSGERHCCGWAKSKWSLNLQECQAIIYILWENIFLFQSHA